MTLAPARGLRRSANGEALWTGRLDRIDVDQPRIVFASRDEHGTIRVTQQASGNGFQPEASQRSAFSRAHDDQIGADLRRDLQDAFHRHTGPDVA